MSDVLSRILAEKRDAVARAKAAVPLAALAARARERKPRGFIAALRRAVSATGIGLIAEIKRASPSRGLIRADFDPAALARAYASGGAACLSVLTDEPYFQGHIRHLQEARDTVSLPILRKDFTIDPYQVVEARASGADAILLIMAALTDDEATTLEGAAIEQGLDVLVEVHDREELERALRLRTPLLGINNRNLKTLRVDLAVTEELAEAVPGDRLLVSESGIETPQHIQRLRRRGAACFLVGESLMRQPDVEAATRALLVAREAIAPS